MEEDLITKRLHISGLTPSITQADLSQKLSSFGNLKALDGFGKLDGLGQPRKYGYVTIETTKLKLARCMNLLSGVTWKGTKLRIGEAKPDFHQRIEKEKKEMDEPPRKKRRLPRGVQGIHAADMSIVTSETVDDRPGWRVTPLGRIIRPIRMRPSHPLPEMITQAKVAVSKKAQGKQKKQRAKAPPVRARRRIIDPTRWGSQHLKGAFLESVGTVSHSNPVVESSLTDETSDNGGDSSSLEQDDPPVVKSLNLPPLQEKPASVTTVAQPRSVLVSTPYPLAIDLAQEKDVTLGLLRSMFGDRNDDDWYDKESVGSDSDMEPNPLPEDEAEPSENTGRIMAVDQPVVPNVQIAQEQAYQQPQAAPRSKSPPKAKLKDLFAPREEEAGFSLLGHLDLELELEDDVLNLGIAQIHPTVAFVEEESQVHIQPLDPRRPTPLVTDTKALLFFPVEPDSRQGIRGRVKDLHDVIARKEWDWRKFCRTETPEETKQWWEDVKGDLTRDWKRRHREAVKSRRRRGGADGGD